MRIATLQFSPRVGEVAVNFNRAESLLMREEREDGLLGLDLLVLPELAFTGYNHPSLSAIAPFLEPTAAGPSTRWAARTAKRLKCTVAVGYPEAASEGNFNTIYDPKITLPDNTIAYNSLVFVNAAGDVVAHHRKSFLYYTDDTWAKEGTGFWKGILPLGKYEMMVKSAAGICMDINPYKFESAWAAFEFANHVKEARAKLVVLSMAWLTRLSREALSKDPMTPDMDTVGYWIERFRPLLGASGLEQEVVIVFANRAGEEGTDPRFGEVNYAGSSCVMGMSRGVGADEGNIRIWNIAGRAEEGIMFVDTNEPAAYTVNKAPRKEWTSVTDIPSHEQHVTETTLTVSSG